MAVLDASASLAASSDLAAAAVCKYVDSSGLLADSSLGAIATAKYTTSSTLPGGSLMEASTEWHGEDLVDRSYGGIASFNGITVAPGLVASINYNSSPQAGIGSNLGQMAFRYFQVLPGKSLQLQGQGLFTISDFGQINDLAGTLQIDLTTGAVGVRRAVAFIIGTSTIYHIGVALDASNRPFVEMTDNYGDQVGLTTPVGAAIPAGTPLQIRLAWNSEGAVFGTRYVSFQVNRVQVPDTDWTVNPVSSWEPFFPLAARLGVGGFQGLAVFNGTVHHVQIVSNPVV